MSDIYPLSKETITELSSQYGADDHFMNIAQPRLELISAIKNQLTSFEKLEWNIKFSPTNRAENCVQISLNDERKKFHFFYVIPLSLGVNLHLYLGDNTFNFFEAYPLLLNNHVIEEGQFAVEATMNTLPHLLISNGKEKYERPLLQSENLADDAVRASKLYTLLEGAFKTFNAALFKIIDGTIRI